MSFINILYDMLTDAELMRINKQGKHDVDHHQPDFAPNLGGRMMEKCLRFWIYVFNYHSCYHNMFSQVGLDTGAQNE